MFTIHLEEVVYFLGTIIVVQACRLEIPAVEIVYIPLCVIVNGRRGKRFLGIRQIGTGAKIDTKISSVPVNQRELRQNRRVRIVYDNHSATAPYQSTDNLPIFDDITNSL